LDIRFFSWGYPFLEKEAWNSVLDLFQCFNENRKLAEWLDRPEAFSVTGRQGVLE
jgi:hypothetical protein